MANVEHGTQASAEKLGFVDLGLVCVACGAVFAWTAGEQFFYSERSLRQPRRCRSCRKTNIQPLSERHTAAAGPHGRAIKRRD